MHRTVRVLWRGRRELAAPGRVIVIAAAFVGGGFLLGQVLVENDDLYVAFLKGLGAAFGSMAFLGAAQQFWRGNKLAQAQAPGGAGGVTFESETEATQQAVNDLNTRVTQQMEEVNGRLFVLESSVFGPEDGGAEDGG